MHLQSFIYEEKKFLVALKEHLNLGKSCEIESDKNKSKKCIKN